MDRLTHNSIEYRRVRKLSPKANHMSVFVHDALCSGYNFPEHIKNVFFDSLEERDRYIQEIEEREFFRDDYTITHSPPGIVFDEKKQLTLLLQ